MESAPAPAHDSPLLTALPRTIPADMIKAMSGIPKMRWVGLGVGLLGVTAWAIGAWQIGLAQYLAHQTFGVSWCAAIYDAPTLQHNRDVASILLGGGWGSALLVAGTGIVAWSAAIIRKH